MNPFDYNIITFLNGFARRSMAFDEFVALMSENYLLKTGFITLFFLWHWFQKEEDTENRHRAVLVLGLVGSWTAVVVARILAAFVLPFRDRPLREPVLNFVLPYTVDRDALFSWNALPSDNAALFFGIVTCIFFISRRGGIIALCNVLLSVGFARVYLGYHHPTDILAGGIIGAGAVSLMRIPTVEEFVLRLPMRWLRLYPQLFNTVFVFLIFLTSTTLAPLYPFVHWTIAVVKKLLAR